MGLLGVWCVVVCGEVCVLTALLYTGAAAAATATDPVSERQWVYGVEDPCVCVCVCGYHTSY